MPPCQLHASMRFREWAEQTDSRYSVVRDVPLAAARLPQRIMVQGRAAVAAYLTERAAARERVHAEDVLR